MLPGFDVMYSGTPFRRTDRQTDRQHLLSNYLGMRMLPGFDAMYSGTPDSEWFVR